jgi:hypothetical protein
MTKPSDKEEPTMSLADLINGSVSEEISRLENEARTSPRLLEELREDLLKIEPKGKGSSAWDRGTLIEVLTPVIQLVQALMDESLPSSLEDPEMNLSKAHIASQVLGELCIAIKDLDNGKVDSRLEPKLGRRSHGIAQNRMKIELLAAVKARSKKLKKQGIPNSHKDALRDVAQAAQTAGYTWHEGRSGTRAIDATLLDSWTKRPPRRG